MCIVCIYSHEHARTCSKLRDLGFEAISTKKHVKFKHQDGRWTVISKGSHEIAVELLKKMEQQIGEKLR
jgi:predicted RNA binding protein YcfA (HicA-like mRNA interferase family)